MQSSGSMRVTGGVDSVNRYNHGKFLFFKRTIVAILYFLVLKISTMYLIAMPFHINLSEIDLLSPIISPVKFLVSCSSIIYMTMVIFVITGIMIAHAVQIQWVKTEYLSRVEKTYALFTNWCGLLNAILHGFCGVVLMHCYLAIIDFNYSYLVHSGDTCNVWTEGEEKKLGCLDERHLFILFSTMISSILYYVRFRFSHIYVLKFPTLETSIWNKIRFTLPKYLKEACRDVMFNMPTVYVFYYIFGSHIRTYVANSGGFSLDNTPIDSLCDLMSVQLFLFAFVGPSFVLMSFKISWDILQMCITMRLLFPVDMDAPEENKILLVNALASEGYIHYLGYYDFKCLTDRQSYRFGLFFKLSHPGGNPINWTGILSQSVILIRTSKESIEKFIIEEKNINSGEIKSTLPIPPEGTPCLVSLNQKLSGATNLRQRAVLYSMRDLSNPPKNTDAEQLEAFFDANQMKPKIVFFETSIIQMIKGSRFAKYLLGTDRQIRIAILLSNSQIIVWAVQGLVNISVASLKQDLQGVVQRDLIHVLYLCVEYYEVICEFRKLNGTVSPPSTDVGSSMNSIEAQEELYNCLKFAVAKLFFSLHKYFDLLNVSTEYKNKLNEMLTKGLIPRWMDKK